MADFKTKEGRIFRTNDATEANRWRAQGLVEVKPKPSQPEPVAQVVAPVPAPKPPKSDNKN